MEICVLCEGETKGIEAYDVIICDCCRGKYGDKLYDKLLDLDLIKPNLEKTPGEKEEPFECSVNIKGGNKQDRINMVLSIMDAEDISLDDLEDNQW